MGLIEDLIELNRQRASGAGEAPSISSILPRRRKRKNTRWHLPEVEKRYLSGGGPTQ